MAVVDDTLYTGAGTSLDLGDQSPQVDHGKATSGLTAFNLLNKNTRVYLTPVIKRVTAITNAPSGDLIVGGLDGELQRWSRSGGQWTVKRLQMGTESPLDVMAYQENSITGLCFIQDDRWFSVNAVGEISEWRDGDRVRQWSLPVRSSARAIAAHDGRSLLAVAGKGGFDRSASSPERGIIVVYAV